MKKMISLRLNEQTLELFKKFADDNDITLTQLIKLAVKDYISRSSNNNGQNL